MPGQEIEFSGDGFGAGTDIDIGVESEFCLLDVVQADERGAFSTAVTVPGSEECPGLDAGAHTLVAKGLDPNGVAFEIRAPIEILAPVQITLASSNPEEVPVGETFVVRASVGNPSGAIGHTTFDPTVVSMRLQPVGPGSDVTPDRCEASAVGGTDGYLVQCAFSTTQVNTYIVLATIDDGSFLGSDEGVLTVTDGRHFVTGGGWFEWPTSAETTYVELVARHGETTNGAERGSFTLTRMRPDGTSYQITSDRIEGLAIDRDARRSWATFSGTAALATPGADEFATGYVVIVYVETNRDGDRIWVRLLDPDGQIVDPMSMALSGADNAVDLAGGSVTVHRFGRLKPR